MPGSDSPVARPTLLPLGCVGPSIILILLGSNLMGTQSDHRRGFQHAFGIAPGIAGMQPIPLGIIVTVSKAKTKTYSLLED